MGAVQGFLGMIYGALRLTRTCRAHSMASFYRETYIMVVPRRDFTGGFTERCIQGVYRGLTEGFQLQGTAYWGVTHRVVVQIPLQSLIFGKERKMEGVRHRCLLKGLTCSVLQRGLVQWYRRPTGGLPGSVQRV